MIRALLAFWQRMRSPVRELDARRVPQSTAPSFPGIRDVRPATSTTTDRSDPRLTRGVDDEPVPMADAYLVADTSDQQQFIRPVMRSYMHASALGGCGTVTTMGVAIAETYALDPHFYGATYCCGCRKHRPVGTGGEFTWDAPGTPFHGQKVGT